MKRRRCQHPSGTGVHPCCMRPAVGVVRVKFPAGPKLQGYQWSKPIFACKEHVNSKEWYQKKIGDEFTGKWLQVKGHLCSWSRK